jgi:hypothetical protein
VFGLVFVAIGKMPIDRLRSLSDFLAFLFACPLLVLPFGEFPFAVLALEEPLNFWQQAPR